MTENMMAGTRAMKLVGKSRNVIREPNENI
jgi:hypothetical protein